MITQFVKKMKFYALNHIKESYELDYEYNDELIIQCSLKVNIIEKKYGWQLSLNNKDRKTELTNDIVQEFLIAFFENELFLELPRFPILVVQRRFIVIEDQKLEVEIFF